MFRNKLLVVVVIVFACTNLPMCSWHLLLIAVNIGIKKGVWPFMIIFGLESSVQKTKEIFLNFCQKFFYV